MLAYKSVRESGLSQIRSDRAARMWRQIKKTRPAALSFTGRALSNIRCEYMREKEIERDKEIEREIPRLKHVATNKNKACCS